MSPPEEIPSMVKLDAPQFWEVLLLIFAAESIVEGGCREGGRHANGTSDEPVVLAADGIQDGRVENGHEAGQEGRTGGRVRFYINLGDFENIYAFCAIGSRRGSPTPSPSYSVLRSGPTQIRNDCLVDDQIDLGTECG